MERKKFNFYSSSSSRQARGRRNFGQRFSRSYDSKGLERSYYDKDINAPRAFDFFDRKNDEGLSAKND